MKSSRISNQLPPDAWSELGGIDFFSNLSLECNRIRLYEKRPTFELCARILKIYEGPSVVKAVVVDKKQKELTLWLFPDSNATYLIDKFLLEYLSGSTVFTTVACWNSSVTDHLFISKINKPA